MTARFPSGFTVSEKWWGTLKESSRGDWKKVFRAYARYGIKVLADPDRRFNSHGHVYSHGEVSLRDDAVRDDPAVALHDLAHWRVAPVHRKDLPNWGLGEYPNYKDGAPRLEDVDAEGEEGISTALGALMAGELFGRWAQRHVEQYLGEVVEGDLIALTHLGLLRKLPRSYRVLW